MRRKLQLALLFLLIVATTETGIRASTDCERWMTAYKTQLAHTKSVRRALAAHERLKHMAQRRLANYVVRPAAPKPMLAHYVRPKYTRQQIMDRFNILCGDLPGSNKPAEQLMEGKMTPVEFASEMAPFVPLETGTTEDSGLIPPTDLTSHAPPATTDTGGTTPPGGGVVGPPIFGGGGGGTTGGGGGGTTGGGGGGTPGGGGGTTPVPPVIMPVPEPSSLVLLATGLAGVMGAAKRRMKK